MPIYRGTGGSGTADDSALASQIATDAQTASDSATAAQTYANNAAGSATDAATSESNAATSASNSLTYSNNAATSATNAATSETNAATSETNAATSESNAATSETNAATSESNAATSAANALTSENNAANSAGVAALNATSASNSASSAATSASNASTAQTAAESAQASAEAALASFNSTYLGAQASDPTLDNNGDAVTAGDWYFNTAVGLPKIYNGSSWDTIVSNLVGDLSPQLGANLDLNGFDITGTGDIAISGDAAFTATTSIQLPTGTTAQRPTASNGMIRYNSDDGSFEGYASGAWGSIGGGATGGSGNQVFIENDQTVTADYTITSSKNAGTFGPVTIDSGVTVTVPSGSRWIIV